MLRENKFFLIVSDNSALVRDVVDELKRDGTTVCGVIPTTTGVYGVPTFSHIDALRKANVIFIDHVMSTKNGNEWLDFWKADVNFSNKCIIGISPDPQPYVAEQIEPSKHAIIEKVKQLLAVQETV